VKFLLHGGQKHQILHEAPFSGVARNFPQGVRSSVIVSYLQKLPYFAVSGLFYGPV